MPHPYTIVHADDHLMFTEALRSCIETEPDMLVIATVTDGSRLIEAVREKKPRLVICDVHMPGMDGIVALKQLCRQFPETRILMLSTFNSAQLIEQTRLIGAHGYVSKSSPAGLLLTAIRIVAEGGTYFEPTERKPHAISRKHLLLSVREYQVLELVAAGQTSVQIAHQLNISNDTVESHRKNMLHKLGLKGKTELLRYAMSYFQDYGGHH